MEFALSEESEALREQASGFLQKHCPAQKVRTVLDGKAPYAEDLWRQVAELGWQGVAIPAEYGGIGFGYEGLCVLAEELGRSLAPIPFLPSVYLATEAVIQAGSPSDMEWLLPQLAAGNLIGCFALSEGYQTASPASLQTCVEAGKLSGSKTAVAAGSYADFAIVAGRDSHGVGLFHVDLAQAGVRRQTLQAVDPTSDVARLDFDAVTACRLGSDQDAWPMIERIVQRAAIVAAFEQIGGAEASLHMARDYALERKAFQRPIASFQAIKHKLANIYIAIELARSHAFNGSSVLDGATDERALGLASAAARVSASEAYQLAATEGLHTHGGIGFTWESDCHLFYRRAKHLALVLDSPRRWKQRLAAELFQISQ